MLGRRYRRFFYTVFLCFLFSLAVETVQLILRVGIFDVDDIMMNTVGGMLGYISYLIVSTFLRIFHPERKKRRGNKL
jgi:glycopeptide antibiotics resistance protein